MKLSCTVKVIAYFSKISNTWCDSQNFLSLFLDQQIAQEQVLEILPLVSEVNAISEELNKHRAFEVVLISAAAQEGQYGSSGAGTK